MEDENFMKMSEKEKEQEPDPEVIDDTDIIKDEIESEMEIAENKLEMPFEGIREFVPAREIIASIDKNPEFPYMVSASIIHNFKFSR